MKRCLQSQNHQRQYRRVAFTPKGGCPLKLDWLPFARQIIQNVVAFTPKGGCPLKLAVFFVVIRAE